MYPPFLGRNRTIRRVEQWRREGERQEVERTPGAFYVVSAKCGASFAADRAAPEAAEAEWKTPERSLMHGGKSKSRESTCSMIAARVRSLCVH
jgi:hypothetical protein